MHDSWESKPDDSQSVDDGGGDTESREETLPSDEVLRAWIERLEVELAGQNLTIAQLRTALLGQVARAGAYSEELDGESSADSDLRISEQSSLDDESYHRILTLENVIAERDELIAELQGRVCSHERNLAALHLEWDHLRDWAEDVEHRIELAGSYDEVFNSVPYPSDTPSGTRFESSLLGIRSDWEIERDELLREIDALKENLRSAQADSMVPNDSLESENVRLLETLEENHVEYERLLKAHQRLSDDYASLERNHLKAINELRAELQAAESRERKSTELSESRENQEPKTNPLESDERIRAFRLHLDGIHAQESANRVPKRGLLGIRWFNSTQKRY